MRLPLKERWKNPVTACAKLLFPPYCLHCEEPVERLRHFLCAPCVDLLETCEHVPHSHRTAVFEAFGPAEALLYAFKQERKAFLARAMAAWMIVHLTQLGWPMPTLLVPVPQTAWKSVVRGFNPAGLLAEEMGKMLGVPVRNLLRVQLGSVSQSKLPWEEREKLRADRFILKGRAAGEVVLVIDDLLVTGATLRACEGALRESGAKAVFGLCFAREEREG